MSILDIVYASAPTSEILIPTLEISHPSFETIRVCGGFEDVTATTEASETVTFTATGIDVSLPARDDSGQQTLVFAIDNVMGEVQSAIDSAMDAGGEITLIFRQYLASDLTGPADTPLTMTISGGVLEGATAQIQASYFDLLNTAWPRDRYTAEFAPGLRYLQ